MGNKLVIIERMILLKGYRILYDRLFIGNYDNPIIYKGEQICDVQIMFAVKLISKNTGEEVLFQEPNEEPIKHSHLLNWSFRCDYCAEQGYKITPIADVVKELESYGFSVDYDIDSCFKSNSPSYEPVKISLDECKDILINNRLYFDNTNNKPTQNVSCAFEEVDI